MFRRPVLVILFFYTAGVLWGLLSPPGWGSGWIPFALAALLLALFLAAWQAGHKRSASILLALTLLPLGLFYARSRVESLPPEFLSEPASRVGCTGRVTAPPEFQSGAWTIPVSLETIDGQALSLRGALRVYVYGREATPPAAYGDEFAFTGRQRVFDFAPSISGSAENLEITGRRANAFFTWLYGERTRWRRLLYQLYTPESGAVLTAMLTGDRSGLSETMVRGFRAAGLAHLFAVSGLHVLAVVAAFYLLFRWMGFARRDRAGLALIVTLLFVLFTGAPSSAVRAGVMAGLYLLGEILDRPRDIHQTLGSAALVTLLWDPTEILSAGFQLSYGVTFAMIYLTPSLERMFRFVPERFRFRTILSATLAAQLAAAPILIQWFHQVSLIGFVTNLVIAPLFTAVVPLSVLSVALGSLSLWLGAWAAAVNEAVLQIVFSAAGAGARIPYSALNLPALPPGILVSYAVLFLMIPFLLDSRRIRAVGLILLLVLAGQGILFYRSLFPEQTTVHFFDVGQGESILITTPSRRHVLVDAASSLYRIERDLRALGVNRLAGLVLTHRHQDHVGGVLGLEDVVLIERIFLREGESFSEDVVRWIADESREGTEIVLLPVGKTILEEDQTRFEIMAVVPAFTDRRHEEDADSNNRALILRVTDPSGASLLLTSDVEQEGEKALLAEGWDVTADLYKAAHHGAEHSNTPEFLERVDPSVVLLSVGPNNYGHPSERFLHLVEEKALPLYRTDRMGDLTVELGDPPVISVEKQTY